MSEEEMAKEFGDKMLAIAKMHKIPFMSTDEEMREKFIRIYLSALEEDKIK